MSQSLLLSLRGLACGYQNHPVVQQLNLHLNAGDIGCLLGPSGCGKTTTLRLIAGFLEPNSGKVLLKGEDITGVPPYKRPVNTVFQKYALFPHLNVFENVAFGLRLKKMDEETIRRKVRDMLEVVGLKGFERGQAGLAQHGIVTRREHAHWLRLALDDHIVQRAQPRARRQLRGRGGRQLQKAAT